MHVALLCNTAWLDEELTMFRYMVVGLMDENVRVTQVVPDRLLASECSEFAARLTWKDSEWDMVRVRRLGQLVDTLEEEDVDLVHAMDGRLWTAAIHLATKLQCPAVLTANSQLDVPLAAKLLKRHGDLRLAIAPTTEPLAEALAPSVQGQHLLRIIHPGVHLKTTSPPEASSPEASPPESSSESSPATTSGKSKNPPELAPDPHPNAHFKTSHQTTGESSGRGDEALCAVISGGNTFDSEYESLFIGLTPIIADYPLAQFFLDGQDNDQHLVWQAAQKLGLLSNISLAPRRLGHRELLLGADVLIHPQPLGRSRGLTLQAMARQIPVLAHIDPWLDYLIPEQTAWVIDRPHPELWTQALERLLNKPAEARALGRSARHWVNEHHLASAHVRQTIKLYQETLGESFKFPGQP